jgi:hypothetical protein
MSSIRPLTTEEEQGLYSRWKQCVEAERQAQNNVIRAQRPLELQQWRRNLLQCVLEDHTIDVNGPNFILIRSEMDRGIRHVQLEARWAAWRSGAAYSKAAE